MNELEMLNKTCKKQRLVSSWHQIVLPLKLFFSNILLKEVWFPIAITNQIYIQSTYAVARRPSVRPPIKITCFLKSPDRKATWKYQCRVRKNKYRCTTRPAGRDVEWSFQIRERSIYLSRRMFGVLKPMLRTTPRENGRKMVEYKAIRPLAALEEPMRCQQISTFIER